MNLHALAELFLHTGPVLIPTDTKPPLNFPYIPVQLFGESLQLPRVWTLKRDRAGQDKQCLKTIIPAGMTVTLREVFTEHIIMPVVDVF